jgi:hypothetical protein
VVDLRLRYLGSQLRGGLVELPSTERLTFSNNNRKSQDPDDLSPAGVAFDILFTLVVPWRRLIE